MFVQALAVAASLFTVQEPTSQEIAQRIATGMARNVPQSVAPDIEMVASRAEQATVVFTFRIRGGSGVTADPATASALFMLGFCRDPIAPFIFQRGVRLRLDTQVDNGPVTTGAPVDRCGAPSSAPAG